MECLFVALFLVVGFFALIIALIAGAGRSFWNDGFQHVARRFHGTLHSGGWFQPPTVWFKHGAAQARLTIVPLRDNSGEDCLSLAIEQREIATRIEIFRAGTRAILLPLRRDLVSPEVAGGDFSRHWQVLTDEAQTLPKRITDGVRLTLDWFWNQPAPAETTISLSPGWFVARKVWKSPRGADLEVFVERACALADQFNLAAAEGVEFVANQQPQLLEDARCGVCGENLACEIVICRRCHTPHHADCWQFTGRCSTYGCGCTDFARPAAAIAPNIQKPPRAADQSSVSVSDAAAARETTRNQHVL